MFPNPGAPNPALVKGIMGYAVATYETDATEDMDAALDKIAAVLEDEGTAPPGLGPVFLDYWGQPLYWAACQMWLAALEDVGDVGYDKQKAFRDSLAGSAMETILGETYYRMFGDPGKGGGNFDYLCHTGEIGQWQTVGNSTVLKIVGYSNITDDLPNYITTGDFIYPMTGNWTWLSS
jgi:hypothetical protein